LKPPHWGSPQVIPLSPPKSKQNIRSSADVFLFYPDSELCIH